jgi:hypothetical protein
MRLRVSILAWFWIAAAQSALTIVSELRRAPRAGPIAAFGKQSRVGDSSDPIVTIDYWLKCRNLLVST